jgi:hypothetical protein
LEVDEQVTLTGERYRDFGDFLIPAIVQVLHNLLFVGVG